MACSCTQLSRVPHGPLGNFKYVFECDKNGKKKNVTIISTNDNEAKIFAEDKICGDGELSGGGYGGPSIASGCFAPESLVTMNDQSLRQISLIRAGDEVLATLDPEEAPVPIQVVAVHAHDFPACAHIHFKSGELIRVSHKQPVYTAVGPVRATDLMRGAEPMRFAATQALNKSEPNEVLVVASVLGDVTLYSLELPGNYVFFVGKTKAGFGSEKP